MKQLERQDADVPTAARDFIDELSREFGLDLEDPNFTDTAQRGARTFTELLDGHINTQYRAAQLLGAQFPVTHAEMLLERDIHAVGLCPHHLLPIAYTADFAYIPQTSVVGLSKIPRLIKLLAARAIIQEELISEIVDTFTTHVKPLGVACVLHGFHTCMALRGVEAREATTTSSAMRGVFLTNDKDAKTEFFALLNLNGARK